MADSKITALTSISTSTDPANDPLVIVDVSDTSMAASGTTKKVTLNQLLGASGTATLASATISGDLTVDTNTLKVDSTNNRVGIGTATPSVDLHIQAAGSASAEVRLASATRSYNIASTGSGYGSANNLIIYDLTGASERYRLDASGNHFWNNVGGVAGTAMTLNSTGLGVGRSPSYRLQASSGTKTTTASLATVAGITTTDTDDFGIYFRLKTDATGTNRYAAITSFDNGSGNGARDLVLQDLGGNVGIGRASTGNKLEAPGVGVDGRTTVAGVSTTATTIYTIKQSATAAMCVVFGDNGTDGFCDIVLFLATVAPKVVSSQTLYGSPAARTYSTSTTNLQLALASGTLSIRTAALSTLNT